MGALNKDTRIDDVNFSCRTRNLLIRRSEDTFDIKHEPGKEWRLTLGHLEGLSIELIKKLPGFGEKSTQEIINRCKEAGIYLRE